MCAVVRELFTGDSVHITARRGAGRGVCAGARGARSARLLRQVSASGPAAGACVCACARVCVRASAPIGRRAAPHAREGKTFPCSAPPRLEARAAPAPAGDAAEEIPGSNSNCTI